MANNHDPFFAFRRSLEQANEALDGLAHELKRLDNVLRKPYEAAGCPFGSPKRGMWIWFEFGQETTVN